MPTMRSLLLALCVGALCASASPALRGDEIASLVPVLAELQTEGGTPPICLFVHGLGQNPSPKPNSVLDDFPAYWGKTKAAVSQFCTAKFLYYNAVDYGWNDNSLQKYVCGQIRDTGARIVFTHSMGNNVVGGGIMSKVAGCDKFVKYSADGSTAVAGSKFWVSLQGVFNGSPAADFCSSICSASLADAIRHPGLKKLAIAFTSKVGPLRDKCGCPGKKKLPSPAINSCSKPTAGIPAGNWTKLQETARDFSWRALCGLGPFPVSLKPVDSLLMPIPYVLLEALSGYGNDFKTNENMPYSGTDGFVNFHSCNANRPDNVWAKIPTARLYVGRMNHGDGTGRAGDGINQDQKPLVFMTESVKALLPRIKWLKH